ncbi:MAG: DUF362 domain-containing protein [Candidatus Methylomirabilales bacterium]
MKAALTRAMDACGWREIVAAGSRVAIKPNFTYPYFKPGVTTSPEVLRALVEMVAERTRDILIVESDGGLAAWTADEAFVGHKVDLLCSEYGVQVVNLSRDEAIDVDLPVPDRAIRLGLPKALLEGIDVLISVPVLKTHAQTVVSLGLKNLWGCIPSTRRLLYHRDLNVILPALARVLQPKLSVMDGQWAMDGLGPMFGETVRLNLVIAATPLGAGELVACRVMGINLDQVPHLKSARIAGLLPTGLSLGADDPGMFVPRRRFKARRDLLQTIVHYGPFRSRALSHLLYLSPLSRLKNLVVRALRPARVE